MAEEVYRIEIRIDDATGAGISSAQQRVTEFDRAVERTEQRMRRMERQRWRLLVSAIDQATPVIERINARAWSLARRGIALPVRVLDFATRPLRSILSMLTTGAGLLGAGAGAFAGVVWPLQVAGRLEQAEIGFRTFLGSAERATTFMRELQRFAAETPFEQAELLELATQLLPALGGNTQMVMRVLRAFGDAAALTGAGVNGMKLALLGFRQIAASGTLRMQELRQVTENLLVPIDLIRQELGLTPKQLQEIGEKGIPAQRAMEAILRALERPVARGGFAGGMAAQMRTLFGQLSMLRDNIIINFVQPWGVGLRAAIIPALQRLNEWFDRNREQVAAWGRALEAAGRRSAGAVVRAIEWIRGQMEALARDPAWQRADLFGRARILWERVVEAFDRWWESGGRDAVLERARRIGTAFGTALGAFLSSALGLVDPREAEAASPFVQAGSEAGRAFFEAFWRAFDADALARKAVDAFQGLAMRGLTIAPGGESPGVAGIAGALFDLWLLSHALRGARALGRGIRGGRSAWEWIRGFVRGAGGTRAAGAAAEAAAEATAAQAAGRVIMTPKGPLLGPSGQPLVIASQGVQAAEQAVARSASRAGRIAGAIERAGRWVSRVRVPVPRWLGGGLRGVGRAAPGVALVVGAVDILRARNAVERGAAIGGALGGWGGAAAGAAIGTAILPGVGTVAGAILGGLAGSAAGSRVGGAIGQAAAEPPRAAPPPAARPATMGVASPAGVTAEVGPVTVNLTVQVTGVSGQEVLAVIRSRASEVARELADEIARELEAQMRATWANRPVVRMAFVPGR